MAKRKRRGERASDLERFYSLFPERKLAEDIFNVLEDYRVENRLKGEYPVLGKQMEEMGSNWLSKRPPLGELRGKQKALEALLQTAMAGKTRGDAGSAGRLVNYAMREMEILQSGKSNVHDSAALTADIYRRLHDAYKEQYVPISPFSQPLDQKTMEKNLGNFGRTAGKMARKLGKKKGDSGERGKGSEKTAADSSVRGDGTPTERGQQAETNGSTQAVKSEMEKSLRKLFKEKGTKPKEVEERLDSLSAGEADTYVREIRSLTSARRTEGSEKRGIHVYPEWDDGLNGYRPDWVRVVEKRPGNGALDDYYSMMGGYKGEVKSVKREFQAIKPEEFRKTRKNLDGEEIDLDAAVEYFVDRKTGNTPSERLYIRKERRTRDISVAFLIDLSGSTSKFLDGIGIIDYEKAALGIMSEAFKDLGDRFAIYGYEGDGREAAFYRVKEFSERYDERVKMRIGGMSPGGGTLTGGPLRHTVSKLKKESSKHKLLVLLTDGEPNGTTGDPIEDTRVALKEAKSAGINTFCITIDTGDKSYLPRMFTHSNWVAIDDVRKLPRKLSRIYRRLTS